MNLSEKDKARFWSKVRKEPGCWTWTGRRVRTGYGYFDLGSGGYRAHRLSFLLAFGEIPAGMEICHRCDTPACVRPDHLFAGTHQDNMHDAVEKGRMRGTPGDSHWTRRHPELIRRGYRRDPATVRKGLLTRAANPHNRQPRGTANGNAKLTDNDIRAMRVMRNQGATHKAIAARFSVTKGNVGFILRGEAWRHVP